MIIHVVSTGETLLSIAREYGVQPEVLIENNQIPNPDNLVVGQTIVVLFPSVTHTVQPGETLVSIARIYGTTLNELFRNNINLYGSPTIEPGQTIVISYEGSQPYSYFVGGYAYPFIDKQLLNQSLPFMSYLIPFTYGFTPEGQLVMLDDEELIKAADVYGARAFMHLSTLTPEGVFDNQLATDMLNNPTAQDVLLNNVLNVIKQKGYTGLDIDFEFLGAENAQNYIVFINKATRLMNANGYPVITALAPKTSDTQPGVLYQGHEYQGIGAVSNYVLLMTYEWGYIAGPPMAVSPIPSIRRVLEYAISRILPSKIYLGISNYGYDWPLPFVPGETMARSISTNEAFEIAARHNVVINYDYEAESPYFYYTENGVEHVVWFEDARSINAKLGLVAEYGFRGALYWNLMRPNPQNLLVLNSQVQIRRV